MTAQTKLLAPHSNGVTWVSSVRQTARPGDVGRLPGQHFLTAAVNAAVVPLMLMRRLLRRGCS